MLVCLCFHRVNKERAESLCRIIADLGGVSRHKMMLCVDEAGAADESAKILQGVFSEVSIFTAHENPAGWPARENALLYNVANKIHYTIHEPWLRLEPDSVPVSVDWLDRIADGYVSCGKPVLSGMTARPGRLSGACVFPANLHDFSLKIMMPGGEPWYAAAFHQISKNCAFSTLMSEDEAQGAVLRVRSQQTLAVGSVDRHCIVQLGRLGDILNILPLVKFINDAQGKPVLMVHEDYAAEVAGLGYCDIETWNRGAWSDLSMAVDDARGKYNKVTISQIHGDRWQTERKCASFCIESWRTAGFESEFGRHGLDLPRDSGREAALIDRVMKKDSRPVILANLSGTSSPFPYVRKLFGILDSSRFNIVDLSKITADRFHDMLGLYDAADLLITTDTATLHLAQASDIPVIALIADHPQSWHGSTPKGNCVLSLRYGEFERRSSEFLDAIETSLRGKSYPKIHHVYQDFAGSEDAMRRNALAAETWEAEYTHPGWVKKPVTKTARTSAIIGDQRNLPFIKDLIDCGAERADAADWIMLTNTDTCLRRGLTHEIRRLTGRAYYSHRYDFTRLVRPLAINEITSGKWYPGSDLFVFRAEWWLEHRDQMPDMILGTEGWDKILRQLIKDSGGGEIHTCCYHERHVSKWEAADNRARDVSNQWNRCLAKKFLSGRGHPLDELAAFNDEMPEILSHATASMPVHVKRRTRRAARRASKKKRAYTPEQIEKLRANMAKARAARKYVRT